MYLYRFQIQWRSDDDEQRTRWMFPLDVLQQLHAINAECTSQTWERRDNIKGSALRRQLISCNFTLPHVTAAVGMVMATWAVLQSTNAFRELKSPEDVEHSLIWRIFFLALRITCKSFIQVFILFSCMFTILSDRFHIYTFCWVLNLWSVQKLLAKPKTTCKATK